MKSGVRCPRTRNCCKAVQRCLEVGSCDNILVTSVRSRSLKPKRCRKSSRRRTARRDSWRSSRLPSPLMHSEPIRHSQRQCASGRSLPASSFLQVSVEHSVCFSSGGNLQAMVYGSSSASSDGGITHLRKQACRKRRGHTSPSSLIFDALYFGSETSGWPMDAKCSRIWCCRPWSICTCTRVYDEQLVHDEEHEVEFLHLSESGWPK
mmetsp:Transcript_55255/g.146813  ORF Transcript_55255/g.146813 Transcript_55255/m.146813 type:complete len:207 (+) Transcript_55255:1116-1736(+)